MLKAAVVMPDGTKIAVTEGTPQGGPLSPLLSNIVLDELDWELARRGHRFVRYADDCNIFVRSVRAGQRVMASIRRFLEPRMRLQVNEEKSGVRRPHEVHFLGFSFRVGHQGRMNRRSAIEESGAATEDHNPGNDAPQLGTFTRVLYEGPQSLSERVGGALPTVYQGRRQGLQTIDAHIRRRLRAIIIHQRKRRRFLFRHLRSRGVSIKAAAGAAFSGNGG